MLSPEAIAFIQSHLQHDVHTLMLKARQLPHLNMPQLAAQIKARQKAQNKLPSWVANPKVVFPVGLSVEQASSERAAQYKASLIKGKLLIDLTGGMGVDFWQMSASVTQAVYIEQQADLAALARHNLGLLGVKNATFRVAQAQDTLETLTHADWVYLDPARRDAHQKKVVSLNDCEPNVLKIKNLLLSKSSNVLLKTSPLLDIDATLKTLDCVAAVHIVAVDNEVKELLFHLKNTHNEPVITAVNLLPAGKQTLFSFRKSEEQASESLWQPPAQYLYEPHAALLKAGAFKLIGKRFGLAKLHQHSHLYTSNTHLPDFQGRVFRILAVTKLDRKAIKLYLPDNQANIAVRNFPQTVAQIRQQTQLAEGGEKYLFATTDLHQKRIVLICEKA